MVKKHWAIQTVNPGPRSWKAYTGLLYVQACGRKKSNIIDCRAALFVVKHQVNPDWYCSDCAKAARLALAAESAPKPDAVVWPKPRPISEAPTDGSMVLIRLPDCNPQWTIGVFDPRRRWVDLCLATAIVEPTHFLPLPPEVKE